MNLTCLDAPTDVKYIHFRSKVRMHNTNILIRDINEVSIKCKDK